MAKSAKSPQARRRLSSEHRRESILLAAVASFAKQGYEGVRTQDLASAAGVSEALIYQHFENKRELYSEAMRISSEALRGRILEAASESSDAADRLERGLAAFLEFVADPANGWPLLREQIADPELAARQRTLRAEALGALVELLALDPRATASGIERGQLEQLAEIIAGGAEALAGWARTHPRASRSDLVSLLVSFVWNGLGPMLQAEPKSVKRKRQSRLG
jgi:AcrR family transcriptional regulator